MTKINSTTQEISLFIFFSKLWSPISTAVQVVQVRVWSPGAEIPIYNIVTHTWPSFLVSQASTTVYQKEQIWIKISNENTGWPRPLIFIRNGHEMCLTTIQILWFLKICLQSFMVKNVCKKMVFVTLYFSFEIFINKWFFDKLGRCLWN